MSIKMARIQSLLSSDAEKNITSGINALQRIVNGEDYVLNAMSRPDLNKYGGDSNVTFYWGSAGIPEKEYAKGYGIAKIASKHGVNAVFKAIEIIAEGAIQRYVPGNKTVVLTDGEYETVLALTRFGEKETWLFNGWKIRIAGDNSEVSTQSVSTQTNPTFSREDLGAAISDYKNRNKV